MGLGVSKIAQIRYARSFLCAGCGLREGHVAPVYAKLVARVVFAVKHYGFGIFFMKDCSGPLAASWVSLGAFWALLGASWVPPGCLLGASWVLLGCLLAPFRCIWVDIQVDQGSSC